MKYRHSFHAGNFADVHKHVALLALLRALQHKDKGFLYVDTHAGAGRYDLGAPETHHGAEAKHGVTALLAAAAGLRADELKDYRDAIAAQRSAPQDANAYPGSPLLAAQLLRAQDRGVCCEILPPECRALERALGGFRRMRVECADGYQQLPAVLPPRERRCLVLIDPPYESLATELDQATKMIAASLERLANAVIALWYPIKDARSLTPWLDRVERQLGAPALIMELWVYPRDSHVGLNGSGLLLVNPPFQFEHAAAAWHGELLGLVDKGRLGGSAVRWLGSDAALNHAGA